MGLSFTAKAIATISGGQIVKAVSGATVLTSTNSWTEVVQVDLCDAVGDIGLAVGVAMGTATSGQQIGVLTNGIVGLYAANAVAAGNAVLADANVTTADAVSPIGAAITSGADVLFGTALSTAASGQLVAVKVNI
jgi:predicted RecA/RadA family phage recombinase